MKPKVRRHADIGRQGRGLAVLVADYFASHIIQVPQKARVP